MSLANVATYGSEPERLDGLSKFNFLYGSNGSGKTTISRVIADQVRFPSCQVSWKAGTRLRPMVYNSDFVEANFNQSTELKGVFTLGERQVDTLAKIDAAKTELDGLTAKIEQVTMALEGSDGSSGKKGELAALEESFKNKCWSQKQKHDEALSGALEGYRGSSEKFKSKILQEHSSNSSEQVALLELEKRAKTVFGSTPTREQLVSAVDASSLIAYETSAILQKRVLGKEDVDIAAMIKRLGNSDWVGEGRVFYEANESVCPFCQQLTSDTFATSLSEYFDETFAADSKAIDTLAIGYESAAKELQRAISEILDPPSRFLNVEKLTAQRAILDAKLASNARRIAGKRKEPSQLVTLDSTADDIAAVRELVDEANALIVEHNKTVANLATERTKLTSQVWKFLLHELKPDLTTYQSSRDGIGKAISAMTSALSSAKQDKLAKAAEIRELEKQTTSVQPTIDGINALLSSFGFQGFKLAKAMSGSSYKLVRANGSDAKSTLSEGEKTFVTFLYFYHLLRGSETDSGIATDRIVVFDDPVSSLDSDILFIVGSLIKGLLDDVRARKGYIRQVFVLTHNVYFHKEVTYNSKRKNGAMSEETFWIVRKPGPLSKVQRYPTNPIKTSYELLWAEVRNPDRSSIAIQNTLRRILENYFKILGGIDFDKLCEMFVGRERIICNSLCSWVHDGSHYAHDDLFVTIDESLVDSYLKVFRSIFEKSHHGAHYKMMMADAFVDSPAGPAGS